MAGSSLSIEQILTLLAETPPRIAALTAGLTPAQLHAPPGEGEWSANEVLAHLRACADVWGGCMEKILTQDLPTIRRISPRTWIKRTDYPEQPFQPSLQAFSRQRTDLLAVLEALTPEGWSRAAIVTGTGKVREWTVLYYANMLASHESPHLEQINQIVNALRQQC